MSAGSESMNGFMDQVAAATPAPGGGAVAAVTTALAAALVAMTGRLARRRPEGGDAEGVVAEAESIRGALLGLAEEDAAAYAAVLEARRLAPEDPTRNERLAAAWTRAAAAPAEVIRLGREVVRLAGRAAGVCPPAAVADVAMAARLATAAAAGSLLNLRANVRGAGNPAPLMALLAASEGLVREAADAADQVQRRAG